MVIALSRSSTRDPLVEEPDALVQRRHEDAVDDEPGRVVRAHGLLARLLGPLKGSVQRLVGARLGPDDLHEREQRRRVEEVHADDALGMLGRLGDRVDRDRGRVRGENCVRPDDAVELGEDLALRLELLDDRLDHEVALREVGELGREAQPPERRVTLLGRGLALLDRRGRRSARSSHAPSRRAPRSPRGRPSRIRPAPTTCAMPAPIVPRPTTPTRRITGAMLTGRTSCPVASREYMTRFLLALLVFGLLSLAVIGACLAAVRGKRPAILSRRHPALA